MLLPEIQIHKGDIFENLKNLIKIKLKMYITN